jgi:hypothetical protein
MMNFLHMHEIYLIYYIELLLFSFCRFSIMHEIYLIYHIELLLFSFCRFSIMHGIAVLGIIFIYKVYLFPTIYTRQELGWCKSSFCGVVR